MTGIAASAFARLGRYTGHPDPLIAASNRVALIIAGNQPFYVLYLYLLVGAATGPSLITLLTTPILIAVPALARPYPLGGRIVFSLAVMLNTLLCTKAMGEASGTGLFLLPCAILTILLFRRTERRAMLSLVGSAIALFIGLSGHYGAPMASLDPDQYAALDRLNQISAALAIFMVGFVLAGLSGSDARPR